MAKKQSSTEETFLSAESAILESCESIRSAYKQLEENVSGEFGAVDNALALIETLLKNRALTRQNPPPVEESPEVEALADLIEGNDGLAE